MKLKLIKNTISSAGYEQTRHVMNLMYIKIYMQNHIMICNNTCFLLTMDKHVA